VLLGWHFVDEFVDGFLYFEAGVEGQVDGWGELWVLLADSSDDAGYFVVLFEDLAEDRLHTIQIIYKT